MAKRRIKAAAAGEAGAGRQAFTEHTDILLRKVNLFDNPNFTFNSASVQQKFLDTKARRTHGCAERLKTKHCFEKDDGKDKCFNTKPEAEKAADGRELFTRSEKKFTGGRCPPGKSTCSADEQVFDELCRAKSTKPCESDRSTCPVQLVWVKGKPNLRFCMKKDEPGYLVPVNSVREALKLSDTACERWPYKLGAQLKTEGSEEEGWDASFFNKHAPNVISAARSAYPEREGLGGVSRKRRGNPVWLAAGIAMGVMAGVLLKQRAPAGGPT